MSSKIEGCCCPPKGYSGIWAGALCPVHKGLRKLAAPVVERKPVAYRWRVKGHDNWVASVCKVEFDARANDDRFVAQELYNFPPELAELQATINKLRTSPTDGVDFGFDDRSVKVSQEAYSIFIARETHYQATIAKLKSEIERLKGGQGEPVAYIVEAIDPNNGHIRRRGLHWHSIETLRNTRDFKEWIGENITKEQPLYTSRPAPVSVRLPERIEPPSDYAYRKGWNACLDKVKELNQ